MLRFVTLAVRLQLRDALCRRVFLRTGVPSPGGSSDSEVYLALIQRGLKVHNGAFATSELPMNEKSPSKVCAKIHVAFENPSFVMS